MPQIVETYKGYGHYDLPVVIIQDGSKSTEKKVYGTISTIEEEAKKLNQIASPAIIVIGEVLNQRQEEKLIAETVNNLN